MRVEPEEPQPGVLTGFISSGDGNEGAGISDLE